LTIQRDAWPDGVATLRAAIQAGVIHDVAGGAQPRRHGLPDPSPLIRPMNEQVRCHLPPFILHLLGCPLGVAWLPPLRAHAAPVPCLRGSGDARASATIRPPGAGPTGSATIRADVSGGAASVAPSERAICENRS